MDTIPTDDSKQELQQYQELKEGLRTELKTWERAFEKEYGHKPSPADVKANSEISTKYKLYHKSFRAKSSTSAKNSHSKTEYISPASALKRVTPQKRPTDTKTVTPLKRFRLNDDIDTIGPTPQLNGRMLSIFDGVQDSTPLSKRKQLNWGEQLAQARNDTPTKSTPFKSLSRMGTFQPE
jgi:DNA replication and checkpoint protein